MATPSTLTALFIGDVIGKPGRRALQQLLPEVKKRYAPDLVIGNGENSAGGFGITYPVYTALREAGLDVVTGGNHIWDKRDVLEFIDREDRLIRPLNYPGRPPGEGVTALSVRGVEVVVINLMGRIFMNPLDCPFRTLDAELKRLSQRACKRVVIVDFHAEATSEKAALAMYVDGRVGAVLGTHTHVQTADERILPKGTAFLTDAGMTGPYESVIGMDAKDSLHRFLTGMGRRLTPATRDIRLCGAAIRFDVETGHAVSIERIQELLPDQTN